MPKKRYTPEEIIQHLRTVELETSKGLAVRDACRKLSITEQTWLVNEVLSDVRIVDRNVNKEAGICSSTAAIPKRNLFPNAGRVWR